MVLRVGELSLLFGLGFYSLLVVASFFFTCCWLAAEDCCPRIATWPLFEISSSLLPSFLVSMRLLLSSMISAAPASSSSFSPG